MKVLVSGYYGYGNLGDEALLAGLLGQLRQLGVTPLVLSGDPGATTRLHGVAAFHRYRQLISAMLQADALVSGGGGLLQDVTSRRSLQYYLGVIRLARLLRRRVLVYGQSLGPLSPAGRQRLRTALRNVPVAVRDRQSVELLDSIGMRGTLVADPALLLSPGEPQQRVDVLLVPRGPYRNFTEMLALAGETATARGMSVGLLPIQDAEDGPEIGLLRSRLPDAVTLTASTPADALAAVNGAGLVLSARLHGLVFAAAAGIRHAGFVYDPKVAGFLERSGGRIMTDKAVPDDVRALITDPPAADGARLEDLKASARSGSDWLREQLGATG